MGTALTEHHATMLKGLCDEVIICYDGDRAGQAAALKNFPLLENAGLHVKVALVSDGMDPDDFIRQYGGERFQRQIIESAVSTVKFKLIYLKKPYTARGRRKNRVFPRSIKCHCTSVIPDRAGSVSARSISRS